MIPTMIGNVKSANKSATAHAFNREAAEAAERAAITAHKAAHASK